MNGSFDVVVIGGGPNGLVAAAALGRAGKKVLLLERAAELGGQSRLLEFAPGFRAAPLGMDPGWLPETVARGLGLQDLERDHPEAPVTVAAGAGDWLVLWRDPARAAEAIARRAPADAAKWPAFVARLQRLAGFLAALYQAPPPDVTATGLRELFSLAALGWRLRRLGRRDMTELLRVGPMPVQDLLDDEFGCAALKAAVGAAGIHGIRQGPRSGGTAFVLLHHLVGAGAGAIRGRGSFREPDAFARAVEAVAQRHGVVLRTAAAVARIEVQRDAVAGVVLEGGERIAAPAVLSTADPATTFSLVDPVWLDPEFLLALRNLKYRGSTACVLYALDALPMLPGLSPPDAELALAGTVTLTGSLAALDRAADAAKYGTVSEPLHVECCVPTLRWPALAPAGQHVLVASVRYVPHRLRAGAAWNAARSEALAAAATTAIEAALPGFGARVLHRAVLTPRDLEQQFALPEGAASHGELTLDQVLFLRPLPGFSRHATPVPGLWWGSCGTHPGPGILGGPGWLAAQRLLRDQ